MEGKEDHQESQQQEPGEMKDLRQRMLALEHALENIGILVVDSDHTTVLWSNERLKVLFGLQDMPRDCPLATDSNELIQLVEADVLPASLSMGVMPCTYSGLVKEFELGHPFPRVLRQSTKPVYDNRGEYAGRVWMYEDVTHKHRIEQHEVRSQKMESLGKFVTGISHEFNNILGAILGNCELALLEAPSYGSLSSSLQEIQVVAHRGASLTRQMNSYAGGQVPVQEPVDLKALLADTSRILQRLLGNDIELSVMLGDDLDLIQGDPYQLEQVLINLALNARDAMPAGGKLSIAVVDSQLDALQARSHSIPAGRYVLMTISDTGVGMTSEVRSHIFEPFFSTKKVGQGSGLGLFMTYGIINHHGGHMEVDSQDGRGSRFSIFLPSFERKDSEAVVSSLTSWETLPTGRETVLVSDDDPSMRNAASNTLKILGYQVLQATDGLSALAVINSHRGAPIDLLVTDVVMPQLDGVQLARQLRESNPDIKLLLISGFADSVDSENVLELGAKFLEKPFLPHSLAIKVREVLDGG